MRFLRSKLSVVLIALLLCGAYAVNLFGDCDRDLAASCTESVCAGDADHGSESGGHSSHQEDGCACLCHFIFTSETPASIVVWEPLRRIELLTALPDFAPDSMPVAIDHPPQLA